MKKIILFLTLASCFAFVAKAYDFVDNGIYYNITSSSAPLTVEVTFNQFQADYSGEVNIPASVMYNGNLYAVTSIGNSAFYGNVLTSVTIPNSITTIKVWAFGWCSNLTSVTIPNSVTSIERLAFYYCGLTSIDIPNSVITIEDRAFGSCYGLISINVEPDNANYSSEDGVLFNKNRTILIQYPTGKTGDYSIPNSVITTGDEAFAYCEGLTSVTIPNSVMVISTFYACFGLISINVEPDNANYSSEDGVLFNKNRTILIQYPSGKTGDYSIPNSVITIGDEAFAYCEGLTSVTIPNSVMVISTFYACSGLISINVEPDNANYSSEDGVLFNKNRTTLIQYPGGKTGDYSIPNSVTSIGNFAFFYCEGLTSVIIPNSVISIGDEVFGSCSALTSITCTALTPPTIGEYTFYSYIDNNAVFYVPCESLGTYQTTQYWNALNYGDCIASDIVETLHTTFLQVYPNPAKGELKITNYELRDGEMIQIYNTSGQLVETRRAVSSINISNLPNGTYIVKVGYKTAKIVKN